MGAKFSGMIFGNRSSRVRNSSSSEEEKLPPPPKRIVFNRPYIVKKNPKKRFHGITNILNLRQSSSNNNENQKVQVSNPKTQYSQASPAQASPARAGLEQASLAQASLAQAGPAQQRQTRSLMNKIRGREVNTNKRQLNSAKKKDIFSLLDKNTTFILQRHATSCANIINKGFETGSTSYSVFGKSRFVAEIAPDSMLSSIGIDECNQVHDYLTNQGTEITKLDQFEYLFCCSELIRTQQTMFLSYFELIDKHGIKIMILPWLNEERAIGGVNKDNLTITFAETKLRWARFIHKTFEGNEDLINKYSNWDNVFDLPDFIYRTPKGPEATFDKSVELEKLYKIKMKESKILTEPGKQSYNADDLLFALPFILYFSEKAKYLQKQLKIFMTGHSRTMVKLINLITLRSASNLDLRSMIKKGVNKIKGVKMITGEESPYYSKPYLEKQQMMNAEIIQLEPVNLMRVFGGRDKFEKFEHLSKNNIDTLSNKSKNNSSEIIITDFNLCRKFPVGFSEYVISKQLKDETFKEIKPFYFFYNSNLGIVYSLVDIIEQKIQTSNDKLYKEGYPLRVFFGMTLLQYVGYLMVAKLVVSKMKEKFNVNPKYDYQGLLDKIRELEKNIYEYVGDTENVNVTQNFLTNQTQPKKQNQPQTQPQLEQQQPKESQNSPQLHPNANKLAKLDNLIRNIIDTGFERENQNLNGIAFKSMSGSNSFTIKKIIDNYLTVNNIDSINIDDIDNIIINMLENANVHKSLINDKLKTYTKYWFCNKLYIKYTQRPQTAGQDPSIAIATKYMEKNATVYFPKADKSKSQKYSITIKQYLFDTLPELRIITDRQEKRTKFVELLHTSLLSTCNIKPDQQKKITTFMKNSFPTSFHEQQLQTPTRENTNKGQGMLERVQKLNERTGNNINKLPIFIPVPFIPLDKDGNNQLDKIIDHMKNMGGIYTSPDYTKDINFNQIYLDAKRLSITNTLKFIYPSINDSVIEYIISYIYKINIIFANSNIFYSQLNRHLYDLLILFYSNYGIQYIFDNYKNMAIMFSIIENIGINIGPILLETRSKKNFSFILLKGLFFSSDFLSLELYKNAHEKYTNEEIINNIRRCYYYTIYKNTGYYKQYGLCFFYFSLYIPDLIYYMSDNMEFNIDMNSNKGAKKFQNVLNNKEVLMNYYKKKVEYLFNLSDMEIKEQGKKVIDEFMTKFRDNIIKLKSSNYHILSKSRKLNTNKLYVDFINNISPYEKDRHGAIIKEEYYNTTQENSNNQHNQIANFKINFEKVIKLITETGINFESNEKAIATISGIPATFDKSLISSHFFAFEFNLDKIKEVCSKGLMRYSKKGCIQFIKADISNIIEVVKLLFNKNADSGIWKFFVEIQFNLINQGFVFANQEVITLIYISRLFGSSFDSILEIFYQSFPYMMFCFEYVTKIASDSSKILIPPCQILNELFDTIGLEKMIILYKYLNITNIEVMEYIKKYGIIFLIYALLTPFHIFQTELTGKNITLHKQVIIDKLKAMNNFKLAKQVKLVFDDKKIIEFIQKVEEKKNEIFGKVPVAQNNSNSNLNLNKFSNNGNKPSIPEISRNEPNGQNADFIWSVFTTIPFFPFTVEGNRNVLDEIIAFYKTEKVGVYKKDIIYQVNRDYSRNYGYFNLICKNYLKINNESKIRDLYNSFWKIIVEDYGNLNIEFSQRANIILWIPLFYKYNKLDFFKNIYLVYSVYLEAFTASEFMKYVLKPTQNESTNTDWENYRYIVYGCDIITNIFQQPDIKFYENTDNLTKLKLLLYYIIEYNNDDVKEYYKNNGLIFFYFLLILPNIILYESTKNNLEFKQYEGTAADEKKKDIDFIMELLSNESNFKQISGKVISDYLEKFKNYVNSLLNTELKLGNVHDNKNKNKTITFVNNGQNNSVKAKYNNNTNSLESRKKPEKKQVDIYTNLLMKEVYFTT